MKTTAKIANYQIAENITAYLMEQTGTITKTISVKMTKTQQLNLFGHYFGKGLIVINPNQERISHSIKVAFGQDFDITASMRFDGTFEFNNR